MVGLYHSLGGNGLSPACQNALTLLVCHGSLPFCKDGGLLILEPTVVHALLVPYHTVLSPCMLSYIVPYHTVLPMHALLVPYHTVLSPCMLSYIVPYHAHCTLLVHALLVPYHTVLSPCMLSYIVPYHTVLPMHAFLVPYHTVLPMHACSPSPPLPHCTPHACYPSPLPHGTLPRAGSPSPLSSCMDHCTLVDEMRLVCPVKVLSELTSRWSSSHRLTQLSGPDCSKSSYEQCMPSPTTITTSQAISSESTTLYTIVQARHILISGVKVSSWRWNTCTVW